MCFGTVGHELVNLIRGDENIVLFGELHNAPQFLVSENFASWVVR